MMLTDRRFRRHRAYLLAEGHLLGVVTTFLLLRLFGGWAVLGWFVVTYSAWHVNWILVDRADRRAGGRRGD